MAKIELIINGVKHFNDEFAAEKIGIAPSTVRIQIKNGKIQSIKFGTSRLIPESEIIRYKNESAGKPGVRRKE